MEIDLGGHPTWYEDRGGSGPPLLLLHGGLENSGDLLHGLGAALGDGYRVLAFDRRGHGRTRDTDAPFHYDDMALETIGFLEAVVDGPAHLVGFSDGGIVSLLVALRRPELVASLVLIGTNFHHDGLLPFDVEPGSPVADLIAGAYAAVSPDGADHFPLVLDKTLTMFATEPTLTTDDVGRVAHPALVLAGDDDLIDLRHTCALFQALPNGQLAIIPGASHLVVFEKPDLVNQAVRTFLDRGGAVETLMPVRRASA